jgi:NAD(P)-dependent dehydrogenase (short-subunit alcohol dehydrogenase family)
VSAWEGRVLIITSASGIGAAAARLAAKTGAQMLVASADEVAGMELVAETGAVLWAGDPARANSAESILSQCLAKFGRVDALFNVAGLSGRRYGDGPVHECTDEGWDTTITQNLTVTFHMCRVVAGRMLQQAGDEHGIRGAILNTASVLTDAPEPAHFATHAYAAAKGGVTALTRAMAAYYAPHKIRVNAVAPAMVRTAASAGAQALPEVNQLIEGKQPLAAGMVDAEDVARAALFLLGPDSRYVTGEVLAVDAGWKVSPAYAPARGRGE